MEFWGLEFRVWRLGFGDYGLEFRYEVVISILNLHMNPNLGYQKSLGNMHRSAFFLMRWLEAQAQTGHPLGEDGSPEACT